MLSANRPPRGARVHFCPFVPALAGAAENLADEPAPPAARGAEVHASRKSARERRRSARAAALSLALPWGLCGALLGAAPAEEAKLLGAETPIPDCGPVTVTVIGTSAPPAPYVDFCERRPLACALDGKSVITWSEALHARVAAINARVNEEIRFLPDPQNSGMEDHWSLPEECVGDCEDIALEKRRRLVDEGLPSAALTLAIAFHDTKLFAHLVLLARTDRGTWVLDNLSDELSCWDDAPYFLTRRERPDGLWTRYEQP